VIGDFVIQGGDPTGTGRAGPGYQFEDELKGNPLNTSGERFRWQTPDPNTKWESVFHHTLAAATPEWKHTVLERFVNGPGRRGCYSAG